MMTVSIACDHVDLLGEAPQWHAGEQRLYWVDAFAPAIRSFDPASGALTSYPMARDIGSFVFTADGDLIAGMRSGFHRVDLATGRSVPIANPVARDERLMLNDGKCDRRGRYWCASVHSDFIGAEAEIFRLDPDLSVHVMDRGFIVGNGIAFSPDDRRMYFADSRNETVWVYDFDIESGAIANRRVFFSTRDIDGRVDGATCDREGNYWCALVHGGAVACISPEGRMIERIAVPAKHPTMVAFGGADLDVLYVTSATTLLAPEERAAWPQAGKLFRIDGLGARGIPEPRFGDITSRE
ncbi:MAG TPA: SMP-30/gluconolactonase/LRE family protein [Hyphomicrobiaceae bacterium]|nr:SMP-30/gluconolactonase/LRE family protein [Hyphomicrobiaceae bacterium]